MQQLYKKQKRTLSSSPCQLRLGVGLSCLGQSLTNMIRVGHGGGTCFLCVFSLVDKQKRELMKMMCLRVDRLKINIALYSLLRGLRITISPREGHPEKDQRSRKSQLCDQMEYRLIIPLLPSLGSFLCVFSFVVSVNCNPSKILQQHREENKLIPPLSKLI